MPFRPRRLRRPSFPPFAAVLVGIGLLLATGVPVSAATVTIRITDRLSDASVTVPAGTTVRFVNADDERHRMRSQSGPSEFDSHNLEPGQSFSIRLSAAGTYRYLDEREDDDTRYHGRIVVTSSGGAGSTGGGGSAAGGGTAGASSATVNMAGRSFSPSTVTIAAGGSVTFRNDDDDEHTATATEGAFNSGTLNAGASFKQGFPKAGTFDYLCAFHSDMTGTVVVTAPAGAAPEPTPKPTPAASPSPTPTSAPAEPGEPAPEPVKVEARDFEFGPADVTVPAGTTVTWRNVGAAPHTVTADDGSFDSELIAAGATFSRTFDAPATFAYLCAFHPEMTGVVEVTAGDAVPAAPAPSASAAPATTEPGASGSATTEPGPTATSTAEPDLAAGAGAGSASGPEASAAAQAPTSRVIRLPSGDVLLRFGIAALIVVAGAILFGRTIGSSVRPAAE